MTTKTKKSKTRTNSNSKTKTEIHDASTATPETTSVAAPAEAADSPSEAGGETASHTLAELATAYATHMEAVGKSNTTIFAYKMELDGAIAELGADTKLAEITPEKVKAFNDSPRVTLTKSGKPKAMPTVLKSRRVLRLALDYAASIGWIPAPGTIPGVVAIW